MNIDDLMDYAKYILDTEGRALNLLNITEKEVKEWKDAKIVDLSD